MLPVSQRRRLLSDAHQLPAIQRVESSLSPPQLSNLLDNFVCPYACLCVDVRTCVYTCVYGGRGQCQVPSSITLHIIVWDSIFHWTWSSLIWLNWSTPIDSPALAPTKHENRIQTWVTATSWFFMCMLEIQTQVPIHAHSKLYQMSHLSPVPHSDLLMSIKVLPDLVPWYLSSHISSSLSQSPSS